MLKYFFISMLVVSAKLHSQNIGMGVTVPTNKLHVASPADPLRLEGLQSGAVSDSFVTVNSLGIIRLRSVPPGGSGWAITGNAGTNTTSNFVGTIDNIPLIFRTNNQRSGLIDPDAGRRNNSIGNRALNAAVTGTGNNAMGYVALANIGSGSGNIAIGDSADVFSTGAAATEGNKLS